MTVSDNTRQRLSAALTSHSAADELTDLMDATSLLSSTEAGYLDGVTAGTAAASKADVRSAGGDITLAAGFDTVLDTVTGTKIGTGVTQKLGFWNATPVIQQAGAAQAAVGAPTSYTPHSAGAVPVTSNGATDLDTTAAALDTLVTEVTNLRTLVDAMRTALVNTGIIKGAA